MSGKTEIALVRTGEVTPEQLAGWKAEMTVLELVMKNGEETSVCYRAL